MFRINTIFALALLALAGWQGAQAAPIHKWVDDRGVTHYADALPEQTHIAVTRLPIETGASKPQTATSSPAAPGENYYSIANQWQRMREESRQRQQRELQRAALKRERQPAPAMPEAIEIRHVSTHRYRHHQRPGHRPYPPVKHPTGYLHQPNPPSSGGFPTTN